MIASEPVHSLVYTYRGLQYALPVVNILEIVQVAAWLPFHGALAGCLGNIVHRHTLVPVFDPTVLGTDLGRTAALPDTVIVVRHDDTVFGFAIDEYVTVVAFAPDTLALPAPGASGKPFVEAVHAYRDNTLITLSVPALGQAVARLFVDQKVAAEDSVSPADRGMLEAETVQHSLICARLGPVLVGVPVTHVLEVIEDYDVTPLFKVAPCLRGLINLRGQVLACLDLSQELGLSLRPLEEHNQCIVLQGGGTELALCVDEVLDIRLFPAARVQKADTVLAGEIVRYVEGIIDTEEGAILMLAVPSLFESPHLQPYQRLEG